MWEKGHFFKQYFVPFLHITHVTLSSTREGMVGGVWEIALPGCPYTHKLDTSISPIFLKIYFCKYLQSICLFRRYLICRLKLNNRGVGFILWISLL